MRKSPVIAATAAACVFALAGLAGCSPSQASIGYGTGNVPANESISISEDDEPTGANSFSSVENAENRVSELASEYEKPDVSDASSDIDVENFSSVAAAKDRVSDLAADYEGSGETE